MSFWSSGSKKKNKKGKNQPPAKPDVAMETDASMGGGMEAQGSAQVDVDVTTPDNPWGAPSGGQAMGFEVVGQQPNVDVWGDMQQQNGAGREDVWAAQEGGQAAPPAAADQTPLDPFPMEVTTGADPLTPETPTTAVDWDKPAEVDPASTPAGDVAADPAQPEGEAQPTVTPTEGEAPAAEVTPQEAAPVEGAPQEEAAPAVDGGPAPADVAADVAAVDGAPVEESVPQETAAVPAEAVPAEGAVDGAPQEVKEGEIAVTMETNVEAAPPAAVEEGVARAEGDQKPTEPPKEGEEAPKEGGDAPRLEVSFGAPGQEGLIDVQLVPGVEAAPAPAPAEGEGEAKPEGDAKPESDAKPEGDAKPEDEVVISQDVIVAEEGLEVQAAVPQQQGAPAPAAATPAEVAAVKKREKIIDERARKLIDENSGTGASQQLEAKKACKKCNGDLEVGDVAVVAPKAGEDECWHPACFSCFKCEEMLVDLVYCHHEGHVYCERHYGEIIKPRCAACDELIFSGEYTKAMEQDWHSGHFCCFNCDLNLTGHRYILRDEHPYCIKCYENLFANCCEECKTPIGTDSKDLSYKEKHWHEKCFKCSDCQNSLVDQPFASKNEKLYCADCHDNNFAARCDGCGNIFRAGMKKYEYKGKQWHEQCFCCKVCTQPIGNKSFIPRDQEVVCVPCYEEQYAQRCMKCNGVINKGGITYKGTPWHRDCFTCTNCSKVLAGDKFTSREDKPYCAECFGDLFAKKCCRCTKPITGLGGTKFISFEERHWHSDCFVCYKCNVTLVGRGFLTDGADILCPDCGRA